MAHLKRARFAGKEGGEPLVSLITPGEQVKTAGLRPVVQSFCDSLRPDPQYTYVLVNAMGYSEYYGSNSNTDWYGYNPHLDFNGLLHAWPDIGQDVEADRMKGKAWPYGYPCFYNATVYAHHKNTDPQRLGFGDVVFAATNPHMKRIELVMRVFNGEANKKGHTSILERVRAGERVDVSMGCKVPFDLCSICTDWAGVHEAWKTYDPAKHKHPGVAILAYHRTVRPIRGLAVTKADYCEHMRHQRGKILGDGRKVFVYNDFPRFFDISFVWIGADRTARVMWYLGDSQPQHQSSPMGRLDAMVRQTFGDLAKTASMEKEIPGGIAKAVHADAEAAPEMDCDHLEGLSQSHGPQALLSTLAGLGIVPKPREFQAIVLAKVEGGPLLRRMLDRKNVVFDTAAPGLDDAGAVRPDSFSADLAEALQDHMQERSCFAPFLNPRLIRPTPKTAGSRPKTARAELLDKIAAQYNSYRLSVLEEAPELFPKSAGLLDPSWMLEKDAGIGGLAGLLLGMGPVIHLLSSHLRKKRDAGSELNTVTRFVADNPTFTTLTTVGGVLRAAMAVEQTGGLLAAAGKVVGSIAKAAA